MIRVRMAAVVLVAGLVLSAFGLYGLSRTPTPTTANTYTVTNTYTRTYRANQNSTSTAMTYFMVCVATTVIGHSMMSVELISNSTTTKVSTFYTAFFPTETDSSTFVSITTSSATLGYVPNMPSGSNSECTYVSAAP